MRRRALLLLTMVALILAAAGGTAMAAPENGSIYFHSSDDLYSVDPTMSSRQIVRKSFSPLYINTFDMSRDGRTIVYDEGCFCPRDFSGPLYTIRRDSHAVFFDTARAKVDITNLWDCSSVPPTPDFDCTYDQVKTMPRFSPDGETIYFVGQYILGPEEKARGLYSVPTGGGEATRIPIVNGDESPRVIGTYALSHDGSTFAISGAGVSTVPVSGGLPRRVTRAECFDAKYPSFSPDDKTIVYARSTRKDDVCPGSGTAIQTLFTTPVDNDGTQPGTPLFPEDVANPETHGPKYYPTFSPDGKYVAFAHWRKDGPASLAVAPATGGSIDNIDGTLCAFCQPVWFERLPDTTIDSGPSGTVGSTSAEFGFSSDQGDATFQCKLDGGTFEACASPKSVPDEGALAEGTHTFEVRAVDTAGGADPTPASRTWKVDTTAPLAPAITSPANNSFDTDGTITISGTAESNSTVEVFEATASADTSKGTTQVDASGAWTKTISSVSDGSHTYKAKAKDAAGNTSGFSNSRTVKVDTVKPQVSSTTPPTPRAGSTNVGRGTNLTATFSEKMRTTSINTTTFKLFKVTSGGTQTQITDVVVSLSSADGLTATLNPFGVQTPTLLLARNTKYKGVLTTGAKDLAGNSLSQQKSWTFTTKP